MSAPTPEASATPSAHAAAVPPAAAPPRPLLFRFLWLGGLVVMPGSVVILTYLWWSYRQTHSITEDAFVEAHIVNVAPQTVSGHVVRFVVEENDLVKEGDILVQLDKEPYEVQVAIQKAAVEVAQANLTAAQAQVRASGRPDAGLSLQGRTYHRGREKTRSPTCVAPWRRSTAGRRRCTWRRTTSNGARRCWPRGVSARKTSTRDGRP